jgi:hypothetical protein
MKKLPAILAKPDLTSKGKSQRWFIGKPGDAVSGAIYLPKDVDLPTEITIGFLLGSREHEVNS